MGDYLTQKANEAKDIIMGWSDDLVEAPVQGVFKRPHHYMGKEHQDKMVHNIQLHVRKNKLQVASNASRDLLRKHFGRAVGHHNIHEFEKNKYCSSGIYNSIENWDKDAVRFSLWTRLKFPKLSSVLTILRLEHPEAFEKYRSAGAARVLYVTRASLKRKKEAHRESVKKARRNNAAIISLAETVKELEEMEKVLETGFLHASYEFPDNGFHLETEPHQIEKKRRYEELSRNQCVYIQTKCRCVRLYFRNLRRKITKKIERRESLNDAAYAQDGFDEQFKVGKIAKEVAESLMEVKKGSTILKWAREFKKTRSFKIDGRGLNRSNHLLDDEDILRKVVLWIKLHCAERGAGEHLSVDTFHAFVNNDLLPRLQDNNDSDDDDDDDDDIGNRNEVEEENRYKISRSTAHSWLVACGARWIQEAKMSYYTDMHERPDVIDDRIKYLIKNYNIMFRTAVWIVISIEKYNKLSSDENWEDCEQPYFFKRIEQDDASSVVEEVPKEEATHVEVHCDQFDDTNCRDRAKVSVRWKPQIENKSGTCEFRHPKGTCKCHFPVMRTGQDESIFKQNSLLRGEWQFKAVKNMRKKTEGVGQMVSMFVCENLGAGLPLSSEQLKKVNQFRLKNGREELTESPGLIMFKYGSNRDGYWRYENVEEQTILVMDVYEALFPKVQLVMEYDWSAGHSKHEEDGLNVKTMNLNTNVMNRSVKLPIPLSKSNCPT